jgi:hypothetical protein
VPFSWIGPLHEGQTPTKASPRTGADLAVFVDLARPRVVAASNADGSIGRPMNSWLLLYQSLIDMRTAPDS